MADVTVHVVGTAAHWSLRFTLPQESPLRRTHRQRPRRRRSRLPRRLIATDEEREQLCELLVGARLVTSDDGVVELTHEALARTWPRLLSTRPRCVSPRSLATSAPQHRPHCDEPEDD